MFVLTKTKVKEIANELKKEFEKQSGDGVQFNDFLVRGFVDYVLSLSQDDFYRIDIRELEEVGDNDLSELIVAQILTDLRFNANCFSPTDEYLNDKILRINCISDNFFKKYIGLDTHMSLNGLIQEIKECIECNELSDVIICDNNMFTDEEIFELKKQIGENRFRDTTVTQLDFSEFCNYAKGSNDFFDENKAFEFMERFKENGIYKSFEINVRVGTTIQMCWLQHYFEEYWLNADKYCEPVQEYVLIYSMFLKAHLHKYLYSEKEYKKWFLENYKENDAVALLYEGNYYFGVISIKNDDIVFTGKPQDIINNKIGYSTGLEKLNETELDIINSFFFKESYDTLNEMFSFSELFSTRTDEYDKKKKTNNYRNKKDNFDISICKLNWLYDINDENHKKYMDKVLNFLREDKTMLKFKDGNLKINDLESFRNPDFSQDNLEFLKELFNKQDLRKLGLIKKDIKSYYKEIVAKNFDIGQSV